MLFGLPRPTGRIVICIAAALAACGRTSLEPKEGRLELLLDGRSHPSGSSVDVGRLVAGRRTVIGARLSNVGRSPLTLVAATVDPPFSLVGWPESIDPGESADASIAIDVPERELDWVSALSVELEDDEGARFELRATSVARACDVGPELHFGAVALNEARSRGLLIANPSRLHGAEVTVSIEGADRWSFSAPPSVRLEPGESRLLDVAFLPVEARHYRAVARVRAGAECGEVSVTLVGEGRDGLLAWNPPAIDCGHASPGTEKKSTLVFTNFDEAPVKVIGIRASPSEFSAAVSQLVVPAKGEAELEVSFRPTSIGTREGALSFQTSLSKPATGRVPLRCHGGGPDVDVQPTKLSLGSAPFLPGAQPPTLEGKLIVRNVGDRPPGTGAATNLFLHEIEVLPLGGARADELTVVRPTSDDAAKGLEPNASVELAVKLTPASAGPKQYQVRIRSSDADEPAVTVSVEADAPLPPPCNLSVSPGSMSFGLLGSQVYKELTLTARNEGRAANELCLLSQVSLSANASGVFSLIQPPTTPMVLRPRQPVSMVVRAHHRGSAPPGTTVVNGSVELTVSNPTAPKVTVPLEASLLAPCIVVSPDELDFGVVQQGCHSPSRTFAVYNVCSTSVVVNGIALGSGTAELALSGVPALPATLGPGAAPLTFNVRYTPADLGFDRGAVSISAVQGVTPVTVLVSLYGTGDVQGKNRDDFTQDAQPKADVLLVIDNSPSMSAYQASLANNFNAFLKYAATKNVDYRIAVTTGDMAGAAGRFVSGSTHPETVLTPYTPNVASKFQAKVTVGNTGSPKAALLASAAAALTPPLIDADNQGFLRYPASLAVIAVADVPDSSPQPLSYYLAQLYGVKGARRANLFSFSAIAHFPDALLEGAVAASGGVKERITTPSWSTTLERLGASAFGHRTRFFLNATPDLSGGKTVEVKVDGMAVAAYDASRSSPVWSYDAVTNSIVFEPLYVPEPGKRVEVEYYAACF